MSLCVKLFSWPNNAEISIVLSSTSWLAIELSYFNMGSSRVDMKVVLLGKEYGGKTSLSERYLYDRFSGNGLPYQAVSIFSKLLSSTFYLTLLLMLFFCCEFLCMFLLLWSFSIVQCRPDRSLLSLWIWYYHKTCACNSKWWNNHIILLCRPSALHLVPSVLMLVKDM